MSLIAGAVCTMGFCTARADAHFGEGFAKWETLALDEEPPVRMIPLMDGSQQPPPPVPFNADSDEVADVPVGLATQDHHDNFAELLLNEYADFLNGREPGAALPLALALHDMVLLDILLQDHANPDATMPAPVPAEIIRLFANDYAAYELSKDSRVTPLMLAVLTRQTGAVRLLLIHKASTQIRTKGRGMYPLDFAAELKDIPVMQLLLGREPDPDGEGRHVVVCISMQKAWLLFGSDVMLETSVSTGRPGYDTHPGEYVVTQKYTVWKSTLYKVGMPNFMRLSCGQTGLHGGYVPGIPASHGCIRLPPEKAATMYGMVQPGDRVTIVE
jgi:lipoprotein-anchoring transpeptidase ErfK/SrfK